jgi:hypothetical protein
MCTSYINNCAINNKECAFESQTVIQGEEHKRRLFENRVLWIMDPVRCVIRDLKKARYLA